MAVGPAPSGGLADLGGRPSEEAGGQSALSIRAVERVCDICDLLREVPDGISLMDIGERTGLPKSTAYRYLVTLAARQYVEFVERDERSQVVRLGVAFRPKREHDSQRFLQFAQAELAPLRDETDETVNIGLLDGSRYVHALVIESEQIIRLAARVGERAPLHCTAIGKIIAEQLPVERLKALLAAEGMPKLTPRTMVPSMLTCARSSAYESAATQWTTAKARKTVGA